MTGKPSYFILQTAGVIIRTTNVPTVFTAAHGKKDYTITLSDDTVVYPRSEFGKIVDTWFYIDINTTTGAQQFGRTDLDPTFGVTPPASPAHDQHWFDTRTTTMKVFNAALGRWQEAIRVFIGKYTPTGVYPVDFGTQVGISGPRVKSGAIAYDGLGKALRDSDGFVTTEDIVFIDGAATHALRLESNVTTAQAAMNIAAYHVVRYTNDGLVIPAEYSDVNEAVLGISVNGAIRGEPVGIVLAGKVHNPAWDWGRANVTLWVSEHGELVTADPYEAGTIPTKRTAVARSIDPNTIIFDQGLGGVGERGADGVGSGFSVVPATIVTQGVVKLSHPANDMSNPIAVGINDPILFAPRAPTAHHHHAIEVTVTKFGNFTGSHAQDAFEYIDSNTAQALLNSANAAALAGSLLASITGLQSDVLNINSDITALQSGKVDRSGDTMTGQLKLLGSAVDPRDAVSLGEVQAIVVGATGSLSVTTRRVTLDDSYTDVVSAFNALDVGDRNIPVNQTLIIEYGSDVYMWTGGSGAAMTASDPSQFAMVGKVNFSIPDPTISISSRNLVATNL